MMRSRSSVARSFRQWICNEVIPTIRKTGNYASNKLVDDVGILKNHMYDKYKLVCLNESCVRDVVLFEEMRIRNKLQQVVDILRTIDPSSEHAKAIMFVIYNLEIGLSCVKDVYSNKKVIDDSYRATSLWS